MSTNEFARKARYSQSNQLDSPWLTGHTRYRSEVIEFECSRNSWCDKLELAWEQVALGFGLSEGKSYSVIQTPYVAVTVRREYLLHIVEKRPNARERFTEFALDTIQNPLEIWQISYDDGSMRLAFIGAYDTKYQMLVVIHADYGHALWNFMNCDKKALNKHRHGILVYQRFQTAKQKKQPEEAAFSEVGA